MTTEELRNIVTNTPDKDFEAVEAGVLAKKERKGAVIPPEVSPTVEPAESTRKRNRQKQAGRRLRRPKRRKQRQLVVSVGKYSNVITDRDDFR
jgi:hypothetical protein